MGTAEGGWNESVEKVSKWEGVRKHPFVVCKKYVGKVRGNFQHSSGKGEIAGLGQYVEK